LANAEKDQGRRMTGVPTDMDENQQSSEPDDLKSIDQALLVTLTRIQRSSAPLTVGQEELLDDWVMGRLFPADVERAAALTRRNSFAAEYILERRLVAAAATAPEVPAALTSQVLKAAEPVRPAPRKVMQFRFPMFSALQWSAAGAAIAATLVAGAFGLFALRENTQSYQRVQLAMLSLDDRRTLSGAPQYRTLRRDGTTPAVADSYRDVDIPADLLRRAISGAENANSSSVASQLSAYLPPRRATAAEPKIAIDSVLADRLSGEWSGRTIVPIRAYDLDEARLQNVRERLNTQLGAGSQVLLTVRR
jgi:hypothetical protein